MHPRQAALRYEVAEDDAGLAVEQAGVVAFGQGQLAQRLLDPPPEQLDAHEVVLGNLAGALCQILTVPAADLQLHRRHTAEAGGPVQRLRRIGNAGQEPAERDVGFRHRCS